MNALESYVKEFSGIVKALKTNKKGIIKGRFLFVSKEILTEYLMKNAFDTPDEKLSNWRKAGWIIADDGHFTSRLYVNGRQVRFIKISLSAYEVLKELLDRNIERITTQDSSHFTESKKNISPPVENVAAKLDRPETQQSSNFFRRAAPPPPLRFNMKTKRP